MAIMGEDVQMNLSASTTESTAGTVKENMVNKRMSTSGIGASDRSFMNVIENAGMNTPKSNNSQFGDIISNFVSKTVRQFCINLESERELNSNKDGEVIIPDIKPCSLESFAAVVMVDVSGYSKLTAALAERGPVGAELLSQTMKGYLDQIIEVIVSYGGDIVKFAGDAVIVYWKSDTAVNMTDNREDIERGELVYKAAYCCLTLLTKLGTYEINIADCPTKTLRIHLGIGAGLVSDVFVGGFPGRWEHFLAGDGVNQLSQVLDLAKAGELAMSHQALKWLVYVVDIRTLNLGDYDKKCIILTGLMKAQRRVPAPMDAELEFTKIKNESVKTRIVAMNKLFMDRTALFKLQSDVYQSNLFQLDAGLLELLCLTELRQITTIFIKIGSLQGANKDDLLEQAQNAIQTVQNALLRCDGSLRQFHVDDKGAVILCFFGLPPLAHENDSKLGISAGIEIREKFLDLFEEFSIGITTGVVSFGGVGAQGRAEYAVMGDAINMAARLMCHKDAKRGILCDQKTFNLCESDFEFENLGETTVKGKANPIAIFRPIFAVLETEKNLVSPEAGVSSLVLGREKEKKAIFATLDQLTNAPIVNNLFFSAEGGQGLSALANYAKAEALKQNCHFCTGKGVQIEQNNSFFVFRSLVCDMVQLLDMGSHNAFGQFKIPNQHLNSLQHTKTEQINNNDNLLFSNRKTTFKKKPVDFIQDNQESFQRRTSYTIMEMPVETNNEEELFSLRFRMALEILDCNESQAALLELVTQSHDDESDAIAQAHLRLHAKDLCDILTRLLHTLTANNKIIIMITETHYLDTLSWDLLLELAAACPRLAIFSFSRPESSIESHVNKRIYRLIEQLPRTKSYFVQGLSETETSQLIMLIWSGNTITSIDPKIADSIYKRTDGNPFFIRSLIVALKESGQWRVNNNGRLTTPDDNFDFDKLVLGYDNQSIVLAQFDRLDRNFQLFLKIASVLGQRFSLDDILFFLTGVEDASQIIERKNYMVIISGVRNTDKYGFLQKDSYGPDGAFMVFKSAIVMKCIYSMMVNNQRQQLHLLVARYLERKINEQNRHRYGVRILEHYQNCNSSHKKKLVQYTEMAAKYFFEKDSPSDSIKYNKQLLELIEVSAPGEFSEISPLQIANYHRELGYSLMMNNELDDAESHLISSLKIMGYALPPSGLKFKLALKRLEATRKNLDKTFFKDRPVPQEEDYTQSYAAKKGASGYSLSNLGPAINIKKPEGEEIGNSSSYGLTNKLSGVSPAQQVIRDTRESILSATQHALVTLAEVFFRKGEFKEHYYVILLGLNISNEKSIEGHMSRLLSLGALALRHIDPKSNLPYQYMEASIAFDLRVDIHTSLQQVSNNATLLFLSGTLEACLNKLEVVSYLSTMAGELTTRVSGLNLKCLLQLHSTNNETALATAKDLYNLSFQRESRVGKLWGCYHIIHNLLGQFEDPDSVIGMQTKMKELLALWTDFNGSCKDQNYLPLSIGVIVIEQLVSIFINEEPDIMGALEKILILVSNVPFYQWQIFAAMNPLALLILYAINNTEISPSLAILIDKVCEAANLSLKSTKALVLANTVRRIFKGIRFKVKRKNNLAVKAWKKGMGSQDEDIYTQAILSYSILSSEPDEREEEIAQDLIKELKVKGRFQKIFPNA